MAYSLLAVYPQNETKKNHLNIVPKQTFICDFNVCKNPLFTKICHINYANLSKKAAFFNESYLSYPLWIRTEFEVSCKLCHTAYQSYTIVM